MLRTVLSLLHLKVSPDLFVIILDVPFFVFLIIYIQCYGCNIILPHTALLAFSFPNFNVVNHSTHACFV